MIKLYDHPLSGNAYKPRLLLRQLGIKFERIIVELFQGENKTDQFAELNPNCKIPVLVDDDFTMWESNAILLYLANKYYPNLYVSSDPKLYGHICQWLFFGKTTIDPNIAMARYIKRFLPEEQRDVSVLEKLELGGKTSLEILNNHLTDNKFLVGDYSIADIACYPYVKLSGEGGFDISEYPNVEEWCVNVESTDGFVPFGD